jgi:hypothetical protein
MVVNENALTIQAALTTPNKIEARTDNVQTLRFYLNDQMVDLARPVTVVVNKKTRFEGMVPVSLDGMLKDQLFLGRGWRYFTASIDLDLAPARTRPPTTHPAIATTNATRLYFTTDDGKTWFPLDAANRPPFVHDGKPAVRAHVFSTDGGKTGFCAYMSKFTPISPDPLIKQPGDPRWHPANTPDADFILTVKTPKNAAPGKPVEVYPGAEK